MFSNTQVSIESTNRSNASPSPLRTDALGFDAEHVESGCAEKVHVLGDLGKQPGVGLDSEFEDERVEKFNEALEEGE